MYVLTRRSYAGYGQTEPYVDPTTGVAMVAPQVASTSDGASAGQAVGLVLAFFSTLMFFTSIMAQGSRR